MRLYIHVVRFVNFVASCFEGIMQTHVNLIIQNV